MGSDSKEHRSLGGRVLQVLVLPFFIVVAVPMILFIEAGSRLRAIWLQSRWEKTYGRAGKRVLLVYSASPNWQAYIEQNWLPRLTDVVITLNWSERSQWSRPYPLEVQAFRHWGGESEFNPMALLFPLHGKVRDVRFWQPFRDFKHGKRIALESAEAQLFAFVKDLRAA